MFINPDYSPRMAGPPMAAPFGAAPAPGSLFGSDPEYAAMETAAGLPPIAEAASSPYPAPKAFAAAPPKAEEKEEEEEAGGEAFLPSFRDA